MTRTLPPRLQCVHLVVNPTARRSAEAVDLLQRELAGRGAPPAVVHHTTPDDFGAAQTARALAAGATLVVAGGGDGTVRVVAEQLRGGDVPLAVLPLGTANIYARNLGLSPRRLRRAADAVVAGPQQRLDLGVARFRSAAAAQWSADRLFFVLAGLGRDAETVQALDDRLKRRIGWAAYFAAGAPRMWRRPLLVDVSLDGEPTNRRLLWSCLVGNAGRIPTGLQLFPGAGLADGRLHVLEVRVTRVWQWGAVAVTSLARWRAVSRRLVHQQARRVALRPTEPALLQLDGDVYGPVAEVELAILPRELLVCMPAPSASGA